MGRYIASALAVWLAGTAPLASQVAVPTAADASTAGNNVVQKGAAPSWVKVSKPMAVPSDAQGLVFVRRNDSLVRLDEDGQQTYVGHHIKILHPQALQLGNVGVVWNPATGAPTVHTLRIHRDGAILDLLQTAEFEVLRREGQLEEAMLDGTLTAIHRVPDLRVGDEIEFAYSGSTQDSTLGNRSFGLMVLADDLQPGRYRLGMQWTQGQKPNLKLTPDFQSSAVSTDSSLDIALDNPGTISPPKDAPPRYSWTRVAEFSDFDDWAAISSRFQPLYAEAAELGADSELKREAARIASDHADPLARTAAALDLVQRQVRYIYVGLNGGNFTPASAEATWQRRYGDCKGKTVLLMALLNELGIAAEPVLANNSGFDDGFDQRLPSPGLFDHVLVRATIGEAEYWLDGTLPPVATPALEPVIPYRWVLPLRTANGSLEARDWPEMHEPTSIGLYEVDARKGFDVPARIVQTNISRGIAALSEYVQFSALTPAQIETTFRNELTGSTQWDTIESVAYRYDTAGNASVLTITGTGPVDWDQDGGKARSMSLAGGGFSPPGRRQRVQSQEQNAPFFTAPDYSCRVTTVRLPEDTEDAAWSFNADIDKLIYGAAYYRVFERRDGAINMIRGYRVEEPEISTEKARRDTGRLSDFDNSMAWIYYRPHAPLAVTTGGNAVPATYERDWTAPGAPCLPPDLLD